MGYFEELKRIVSVHKCVSCRTILSREDFDESFCPTCKLHWQMAMTQSCPECYGAAAECSCMPKQLSSAGALTLRRLFFYSAKKDNEAQNKLVYFLKHYKNKRASRFAASQLLRAAKEELDTLEVTYSNAIVVNMPRGRSAVKEYGFDQSKEVCRELADMLGATYADVIKRRVGGKEQKKLNAAQRRMNIKKLMRISSDGSQIVRGKYVLLFDDVVTTGASMAACVSLLRKAGARGVICLALASDLKKEISELR